MCYLRKNLLLVLFILTQPALSVVVNTGFTDAKGSQYTIEPVARNTVTGEIKGATIDLNGLRIETIYNSDYRPISHKEVLTDDNGNTVAEYISHIEYNPKGDVTKMIDALGHVTTTEYNPINKVAATTDANGNRTLYEYDGPGRLYKTTYADGSFELMKYDGIGNVIAKTDKANNTSKTTYDRANRLKSVIRPDDTPNNDNDNPVTTNNYDAAGRLSSIVDARGNTTRFEYSPRGQKTKIIDALGNETRYVYNNLGQKVQMIDALGRVMKYQYDLNGNLIKTIYPDNTPNDDSDNLYIQFTYDELNRKIAETDLAGRVTKFEYSKASQLTAVIDALNQRTEYSYDQRGNKVSQTDANGHTTSWTYDALSRVNSRTLPAGQTETFSYDPHGNMISKTDFNGDVTFYEYNNLNQQVRITYADQTTVEKTYTILGQMASITNSNGTTSYQYDAQKRLTRIDYPTGLFIAYQYDKNGNRTQITTANQTISYAFDQLNRLSSVTDISGTTQYLYDAVGNKAKQINSNGIETTYNYDLLNRLTDLTHTDANNQVLASFVYQIGPNGNREKVTEVDGRVINYVYDDLYRLISEQVIDPIDGNHSSQWSYDAVGNRLEQVIDGTTTTYTYNSNDQLLSEIESGIETNYAYDNNGNTLSKSIAGVLDTEYGYRKDNYLIQAITPFGSMDYQYDANGLKVSQSVNGEITRFLLDPNQAYVQVIEEHNAANIPQVTYVYGDDLIKQTRNGAVYTYGYDGLGSTRLLTSNTGAIQNSYAFQAFGELDYQTGNVENNYLYTGEQYDNNLGFYYLRARFYNPEIGRFQNMDTFAGLAFEPLSLHKYLYAHANPINNTDPSGNFISLSGVATTLKIAGILSASYATGQIIGDIYTGNFEFSARNIGITLIWAYAGSKVNVITRPLVNLLRRSGCLGNSFAPNTLVLTNKGHQTIESITVGDEVLSFNEETQQSELKTVTAVLKNTKITELITVTLASGESFEATPEHLIYADGNWVQAQDLIIGMFLQSHNQQKIQITAITISTRKETVYDLSVEDNHNFYISKDNVLVHNMSPCEKAAKVLAQSLPSACKVRFACDDFVVNLERKLLNKNMKGKRLCVESKLTPFIGSLDFGQISKNQQHFAVQVGDLVFDNVFPEGIPFSEWSNQLGVDEGIGIEVKSEKMTGEFASGCIPRK